MAIDKASQLVRFDPVTKGLTSLTSTLFPSAQGLAIEPNGNVLVVSGDDIFRVNLTSGMTTTLVDNANVNGGFFGPKGIAVGPTGRIFVTEFFKFAWEINAATGEASMLSLSRDLVHPNVVEVRSDGVLVVMESNTNLVRISPSSGVVDMMWYGLPGFSKDMAIESDDDILVTSTSGVFRFDASSGAQSALTWDRPFFNPLGIAVAPGACPRPISTTTAPLTVTTWPCGASFSAPRGRKHCRPTPTPMATPTARISWYGRDKWAGIQRFRACLNRQPGRLR